MALNALEIPYAEKFDVVFFKSILGSIGACDRKDKQVKAINEMHKAVKNNGELWFAENLTASPFHKYFRKKYIKWGNTWRYVTIEEMKEYLSVFSKVKYTTVGFLGCFGRTPIQKSLLGKLDRCIADKLVPQTWRYIIIGIAWR